MTFDDLTKDELIVLLTDRLLWASSVTGEIKFGTDDERLLDLNDRAVAGNDAFTDLIRLVSKLTGRQTQRDPREVRELRTRKETNRQANERAARLKAKAEAEWSKLND